MVFNTQLWPTRGDKNTEQDKYVLDTAFVLIDGLPPNPEYRDSLIPPTIQSHAQSLVVLLVVAARVAGRLLSEFKIAVVFWKLATRIVHFGEDLRCRIPVLADAGYTVKVCGTSVSKLNEHLGQDVDAVAVDEDGTPSEIDIVTITRSHNWVPLILFQGMERKFDPLQFDALIHPKSPAQEWSHVISRVVGNNRVSTRKLLVAQSVALSDQLAKLQLKLRSQCSRATRLCSR